MTAQYRFKKQERLCSRRLIDPLFMKGHKLLVFPFSVRWMICDNNAVPMRAQVLISTSKKKFHHAVDRNRVKRLTRECYRLQKNEWYGFLEEKDIKVILSINYIHDEIFEFATLQSKYAKLLERLEKQIAESL